MNGYENIPPSTWNASDISHLRDKLRLLEERVAKLEAKKVVCGACGGAGVYMTDEDEYNCRVCGGSGRQ